MVTILKRKGKDVCQLQIMSKKVSKQDEELVMLVPNHYVHGTTVLFIWHKNILAMMVEHS